MELHQSFLSEVLFHASTLPKVRRVCLTLALRLEGRAFYSLTARRIMQARYGVSIGAYSYGGCFDPGVFPSGVVIGRYVSIAKGIKVLRRNRDMSWLSTHPAFFNPILGFQREDKAVSNPLTIEHDAWIGARVIITPGCRRIGLGAVVGAGAVVTKSVPDFAVVGGNPARHIRQRFPDEVCEMVRASQWWLLPLEDLTERMSQMTTAVGDAAWLRSLVNTKERNTDACSLFPNSVVEN